MARRLVSPGIVLMAVIALLLLPPGENGARAEAKADSCITCHGAVGGKLAEPVEKFKASVHAQAGVSCADCHGGVPASMDLSESMSRAAGFVGKPRPAQVPELCARCHSDVRRMRPYNIRTDQLAEYRISQHGRLLFESGDIRVATCISCHGTHDIRKKTDPLSLIYHSRVPETCARCHSDVQLMKPYKIPTDQAEQFAKSYHGQVLAGKLTGKNPALAPNCASCHGIHGATPPGVREVSMVCGNCHATTSTYFGESPHFLAVQRVGMPRCVDCHGNHNIQFPTVESFGSGQEGMCVKCHDKESAQYARGMELFGLLSAAGADIEQGEASLKTIQAAGMNVDALAESLERAKSKFVESGPVSHTLNLEKVQKLSSEAREEVKKLMAQGERVKADVSKRRRAFVFLIALIGLIVGLIYIKRESLKRELLK